MIDVIKAMLDPTMVFKEPKDVVANVELSHDQKIEVLHRWEYDACQLEVVEEEARMEVCRPGMFDRVLQARAPVNEVGSEAGVCFNRVPL